MCNLSDIVLSIPFSGLSFSGIIIYGVLDWALHAIAACRTKIDKIIPDKKIKLTFLWQIIVAILSIGYAFSDHYKGVEKGEKRKDFIERCNFYNLIFSLILMLFSFYVILFLADWKFLMSFILVINGYRFISRSLEIILAFGCDVFDEKPKSNLNKFQRLSLAIKSYFEIYLYSASFYITLIYDHTDTPFLILKSLLMSLSVGTLTNIAYSQGISGLDGWLQLFPFIQVFATLSLVVLSLTMYVSRNFDSNLSSRRV